MKKFILLAVLWILYLPVGKQGLYQAVTGTKIQSFVPIWTNCIEIKTMDSRYMTVCGSYILEEIKE